MAPLAFQFGKYDIFTRTGTPTLSTSKEMKSSPVAVFDTVIVGRSTGFTSPAGATWARFELSVGLSETRLTSMRCHSFGPPDTGTAGQLAWFWNQEVPSSSHRSRFSQSILATTGCVASGTMRSESATWYTCHGPERATSVSCGFWAALATMSGL